MIKPAKPFDISDLSQVEEYRNTGDRYLVNAAHLWGKKEIRRASEMLWGGITQYLKGLRACKGGEIKSHKEFLRFVKLLAQEQKDPYLRKEFVELELLHNNFYDEEIPEEDFSTYYHRTQVYVRRINKLIRVAAKRARFRLS